MTQYKVGKRINLNKAKQREARRDAVTNTIFWLIFGSLATYGLGDLILRANGIN